MRYSQLLSYVFSVVSLVSILLILIAGSNKHVLPDFFFLKANTGSLTVPSKLSNSTYLKDLSKLTGSDLVGQPASASSLGLANSYTIALLAACSGSGSCTSPHFGFHFDPISDLKLDNTGVQGSFTSSFLHTLSSYGTTSTFLAVAYLVALIFTFITPILTCFSSRSPRVAFASATTSVIATLFLFAASNASLVVFKKVRGAFNKNLEPIGVTTALGNKLFILSWVAEVLSLITSILLIVHARRTSQEQRHGKGSVNTRSLDKGGEGEGFGDRSLKGPGFLQRLPTWKRHKYSQIEKQPAVKAAVTGGTRNPSDNDVLLTRGFGGGIDEEDEEHDHELARGSTRGIQLQPMGSSLSREIDTAYEPYRNQAGAAL